MGADIGARSLTEGQIDAAGVRLTINGVFQLNHEPDAAVAAPASASTRAFNCASCAGVNLADALAK